MRDVAVAAARRRARGRWRIAFALFAAMALPGAAGAAELHVRVVHPGGAPAAGLVVTVEPVGRSAPVAAPQNAVMDQVDRAFQPELLVVPVGSTVSFPNSDVISHQVYSFSKPKRFQLPLYRGVAYSPLRFDEPGLVTLGCNIHDSMIGYILVTAAPWFGITRADGSWSVELPAGDYRVHLRHPRMREQDDELGGSVTVGGRQRAELAFTLAHALRPAPLQGPARQWDY